MVQVNLPDPPIAEGAVFFGTAISSTEFQGAMPHGLFKTVVPDPRNLEGSAVKYHADLSAIAELRMRVNRLVTGAKKKNVPPYAHYIVRMVKSGEGFTPQIVLWSEKRLRMEADPNTGLAWLLIPHGLKFVAVDGDTQTTARHMADQMTQGLFDTQKIKVVVMHGVPEDVAQQVFSDCNAKGTKVTTSMAIGLDNRDDATQLSKFIERHVAALDGKVNRVKRQLSRKDDDVITMSALRASVVCFIEGINGVQHQTQSVEIEADKRELLENAGIAWYEMATEVLNSALSREEREHNFASAPSVWCAIGAIGHDVLEEIAGSDLTQSHTPNALAHAFRAAAKAKLEKIDWTRKDHWLSAGAKKSTNGSMTLGGPKETGYLVYKAINDGSLKKKTSWAAA